MIHKIKRSNNQNIYQLINDKLKGSNYAAEHCLTIRKNSGPSRAARRINFESIVLSEGSQAQRSHVTGLHRCGVSGMGKSPGTVGGYGSPSALGKRLLKVLELIELL